MVICQICNKEIEDKEKIVKVKCENFKGLNGEFFVCKNCIIEKVLKPYGYSSIEDYLRRYWGIKCETGE
jgi:hypothetical protein